jgi:acyl-CoA thioesterase-2
MSRNVEELLHCLNVEDVGEDRFLAHCERRDDDHIFGGQVLAQALRAAGHTVDDRPAHAVHALFLTRGTSSRPLEIAVERLRDGRSFSARRARVSQGDQLLFTLQASFHVREDGYHHQFPMPEAPDPEELPSADEAVEAMRTRFPERSALWAGIERAIEVRHTVYPAYMGGEPSREPNLAWFRTREKLPDDPTLHQSVLAYASDISLNDNAYRPHSGPDEPEVHSMASVDHAMWFHAPARADEWILFHQESPRAGHARGYARGSMYTRDGSLIASMGQDSLMRPQPG